jgi:LIM domain kinase 1
MTADVDVPRQSTQPLVDGTSGAHSQYSTTVIRSPSPNTPAVPPPSLSSILTVRLSPDLNEISGPALPAPDSFITIDSYHTAHSSVISTAAATAGGSTIRAVPLLHRFSLIRPGARRQNEHLRSNASADSVVAWNPLDLFFSSGLLVAKCDVCTKRFGWKPVLECDDCGLRFRMTCTNCV